MTLKNVQKIEAQEIHKKTPWSQNFELELAKKLINKSLKKTEIAYRIAHDLDEEMKNPLLAQSLKLKETDPTDSIFYLIEAIKHVAKV